MAGSTGGPGFGDPGGTEHVHAVVVGSGFGGSVAAYRFAEAGRSVVLLERGKAYPPGGFARTPTQMSWNFWDPSAGLHGLFDVWTFGGAGRQRGQRDNPPTE
jgi:cholesterol oxidase